MPQETPRARRHCRVRSTQGTRTTSRLPLWVRPWVFTWSLVSGVLALAWLLLRSAPKPSRFVYPCQQAAFSTATLAFGAPLVAALVAARRRVIAGLRTPVGMIGSSLGLVATLGVWGYLSSADDYRGPMFNPPGDYRAQVFHVSGCPQEPVGPIFTGVDNLVSLMGREGLKFYRSATESPVAGPDGLIAADDVVVIKINYQWPERGGSNVDVLSGLMWRLVAHPDNFTGEIVVCENAQFNSVNNFDRSQNNAEDHNRSPHDAVVQFQNLGYTVSHYDWTARRYTQVQEYSAGNMTDGYIVYGYDSDVHGRLSYPKFRTVYGTYVSLKYGLWYPESSSYDREKLKFINLPVLKSHSATYGVTACVKNYMGVVTGALSTSSHNGIRYGILGALLGEIQVADLNILDCIWINANPHSGPATSYGGATRRDELVASTDPVAADIWAVRNILIPAFLENGFSPPWPQPDADPDNPNSDFRQYLDNSMHQILEAGYDATNDRRQIDLYSWNGDGDFNGDSDVDADDADTFASCFTGPDGGPIGLGCAYGDFDDDDDIDCDDWAEFLGVWTGPGDPPPLPQCDCPADLDGDGTVGSSDLAELLGAWGPNPGHSADFDEDGDIDAFDLAQLLGHWGACE